MITHHELAAIEHASQRGAHRGALLAAATIAELSGQTVMLTHTAAALAVSVPTANKRTLHHRIDGKLTAASIYRELATRV